MKKTCTQCKTSYEYDTEEEHRKYFYKKGNYFQNECIPCVKAKVREAQKRGGKYDYRSKDKYSGSIPEISIGNLNRC